MKHHSRSPRTPSRLSDSLQRHLNAYALAASAAGVGVLALAQSAEAKIVYTRTHRHISIGHPVVITLDHGAATFRLSVSKSTATNGVSYVLLGVNGRSYRKSVGGFRSSDGWIIAYAFNAGSAIGPKRQFDGELINGWMGRSGGFCFTEQFGWHANQDAYLGLRFPPVNGKYHYGWARLNTHCKDGNVTALLTGYAYETIPNKPIIAGKTHGPDVITVEPGSLGGLAQGSAGRVARH